MKEKVRVGVVGLGQRGFFDPGKTYPGLIHFLANMEDVEVVAVCDEYEDRVDEVISYMKEHKDLDLWGTTDYRELVTSSDIDAVVIACSWEMHVPISVAAMRAGKAVALEVGGAYSLDDCWRLVRCQEETNAKFMFLENCCYGRDELMVLNMVRQGKFGNVVHCSGGYQHDLRGEISFGEEHRHYRLRNYLARNCDNYPTHEVGPISKVLNINRGNRMVSLVAMSSKAEGLNEYNKIRRGEDHNLANADFKQGDIVTTIIKCAGGETIVHTLDTTLPRGYYSRGFTVRGTKGMYTEETGTLVMEPDVVKEKNNVDKFRKEYDSPIWEEYDESGIEAGHGGMDWHILRAFIECVKDDHEVPIDVYDAATWMSICVLSEASIAHGGAPMEIPDFTSGGWLIEKKKEEWKYSL